jgi:hypothetical protein
MKDIAKNIVIFLLVLVIICLFLNIVTKKDKLSTEKETPITRTETIVIHDTIIKNRAEKPIITSVIDSILVFDTIIQNDTIIAYSPIIQKHYTDTTNYSLWVSGGEPLLLDSLFLYRNTEVRTIYVEDKKMNMYMGGKIGVHKDAIIPYFSIGMTTKNDWLIGIDFGYFDKTMMYGFDIKYKIK